MLCGNCFLRRLVAIFMIAIGIILLICFMPFWMWLALLGAVLIGIGCFVLVRKFW